MGDRRLSVQDPESPSTAGPAGYLRRASVAQLTQELGTAFFQQQQLPAAMADTFLEHLCLLDIDSEPVAARSTSIIATIGKTTQPWAATLGRLHDSGVSLLCYLCHGHSFNKYL